MTTSPPGAHTDTGRPAGPSRHVALPGGGRSGPVGSADTSHEATWVLLLLVALVIGTPILWAVSVGAVRELRRARAGDPRVGCQAWVSVRGLPGKRYRCGEPVDPGGVWCRRHEVERARGALGPPDTAVLVDEPQTAGRALVQARVGVPVAVAAVIVLLGLAVWSVLALR